MDFTRTAASHGTPTGRGTPRWRRYVALGDSFTEGLWDVPDGVDPAVRASAGDVGALVEVPCRGWADLLAAHLAERSAADGGAGDGRDDEPFRYANLAVRGRLLGPIVREQVPAAVELGPDLVSLVGGGNDILRPGVDPDALAAMLEGAVAGLRAAGVDVLLATGFDTVHSPVIRRTRGRTAVFNAHVWTIANRHGAHVLDMWGMRSLHDWRMWADDRIHLTTDGHRRVAQAALVALGLPPDDERWDDPLAPLPPLPRAARVRADAAWLRTHASPWLARRLHGRSSGDARAPKRPTLEPVG
ncbi:SGNH/GDSL hydrolase family protein [Actinotalea fermentans]|uniref:SGNH hydrolase n=1 Tax=Actinotalea fermentans TaxID=43671 RepID=A0A511YXP5_9CELL|nr:SGNH/GDSL hydrolase family protein [Actinotalea fermentans]KGM16501.1 G-D-S-L family lipolytic protein [Actinotalea fermentans ATCC 43279 = JCM 9966 = DSM 3133]GEN79961.1 SGNH hydrolase [Actinotalea fermentans]